MTTVDVVRHDSPPAATPPPDAREAATRPFGRPGHGYLLLMAALGAIVALGVVAWTVQLRRGMGVAGYNDRAFWAIYIADVVTFIGVSYGGAVISAILRLTGADWRAPLSRLAEGTAVVTVLIGGAFIIPHLGRPDRIWELVARPNLSSPIFWDFVAISTYTIGSIVFFALPLIPDLAALNRTHRDRIGRRARWYSAVSRGWVGAPRQRAVLHGALGLTAIMIIPLAVSVHSVLSWAFALVSRPWWHESIWAPYFVVAALYSGVALVILVVAAFRRAYRLEQFITERHFVRLGFILATFAAVYLYLTFADILPDAYVGEPGPTAVFHELLLGHFAAWFWLFIVAAGLLPLLLVAIPRTRTTKGMVVASAVVVPAMWLKRMLMVVDPATYDRITGVFGAYHFTWVAISITLAGLAAIPLLLMLLFRVVPLLSVDEMEQLGVAAEASTVGAERATSAGAQIEPLAKPEPESGLEPVPAPVPKTAPVLERRRSRWSLRRASGALVLTLLAGGALSLVSAPKAHADATPMPMPSTSAAPASATVALMGMDDASGVHLTATLTDSAGMPVTGANVQFFEYTTVFGPKGQLIPLGSAVTGTGGIAKLTTVPTVTGNQRFDATFAGNSTSGQATTHVIVAVTTAHPAYQPAPAKPFATVGKALVGVLLSIVALVLITLAVQVERVRRVCRAGL